MRGLDFHYVKQQISSNMLSVSWKPIIMTEVNLAPYFSVLKLYFLLIAKNIITTWANEWPQ